MFAGDLSARLGANLADRVAVVLLEHLAQTRTSGKVHTTALKMARKAEHPLLAGAPESIPHSIICDVHTLSAARSVNHA